MEEIERKIYAASSGKAISGPFQGMQMSDIAHFGVGHSVVKLLGTFEHPIHRSINSELAKNHDLFINIGCGDGYYGVGVKLRSPSTNLLMVDIDSACLEQVKLSCSLNGISDYTFRNEFNNQSLQTALVGSNNPWVFVDIEGAEVDLLNPAEASDLSRATITVEMHDCFRMGVTNELIARFQRTHRIINIVDDWNKTIPRLPEGVVLPDYVIDYIRHEGRCTRMNWLYMTPLQW